MARSRVPPNSEPARLRQAIPHTNLWITWMLWMCCGCNPRTTSTPHFQNNTPFPTETLSPTSSKTDLLPRPVDNVDIVDVVLRARTRGENYGHPAKSRSKAGGLAAHVTRTLASRARVSTRIYARTRERAPAPACTDSIKSTKSTNPQNELIYLILLIF